MEKHFYFAISVYDQINIATLEKIHVMIQTFCQKYGWFYVDVGNIRGKHLYIDGLHLMEESKIILARNFISYLNQDTSNYFLHYSFSDKHTHHPFVKI